MAGIGDLGGAMGGLIEALSSGSDVDSAAWQQEIEGSMWDLAGSLGQWGAESIIEGMEPDGRIILGTKYGYGDMFMLDGEQYAVTQVPDWMDVSIPGVHGETLLRGYFKKGLSTPQAWERIANADISTGISGIEPGTTIFDMKPEQRKPWIENATAKTVALTMKDAKQFPLLSDKYRQLALLNGFTLTSDGVVNGLGRLAQVGAPIVLTGEVAGAILDKARQKDMQVATQEGFDEPAKGDKGDSTLYYVLGGLAVVGLGYGAYRMMK